jgi:hypothetical protein
MLHPPNVPATRCAHLQAHFIDRPADSALVYAFPSTWNWPAGSNVDVWVYSDADTVELLLNGASQGSQAMTRYAHATWNVPYAPGSLVAVGYKNGSSTPVGNWTVTTAGAPAQLVLSIKDGVGAQLVAGCAAPDTALLAVALVPYRSADEAALGALPDDFEAQADFIQSTERQIALINAASDAERSPSSPPGMTAVAVAGGRRRPKCRVRPLLGCGR